MRWLPLLLLLFSLHGFAQNLVPNAGFEDYSACPDYMGQIDRAVPWHNPTTSSPDYFNVCATITGFQVPQNAFGNQIAHLGNAYAGVYAFSSFSVVREYVQIGLADSLVKGIEYVAGFWISLGDKANYSVSTVGAYLSKDSISSNNGGVINAVPQILNKPLMPLSDKENWVLVMDTFVSLTGGEKYLTIGNFNGDGESDTTFLGTGSLNSVYSYYYIDDVFVMPLDSFVGVAEKEIIGEFNLYPNPNNGTMHLDYTGLTSHALFEMYDVTGRKVATYQLKGEAGKINISEQQLTCGLYTYRILNSEMLFNAGKVIVQK